MSSQSPSSTHHPLANSPFFLLSSMLPHRNIPLVCGISCPGCVPSQFFVPPSSLLAGRAAWEDEKSLATAQQQRKHQTSIILISNPKHSTVPTTRQKKITFFQMKPGHCQISITIPCLSFFKLRTIRYVPTRLWGVEVLRWWRHCNSFIWATGRKEEEIKPVHFLEPLFWCSL